MNETCLNIFEHIWTGEAQPHNMEWWWFTGSTWSDVFVHQCYKLVKNNKTPSFCKELALGLGLPTVAPFFWIQLDKTNTFGLSSKMRWIEFALSFLISTVSKLDASRIQSWFKGYARETHIVDDWQSHKVSKELIQWLMGYVIWHISPQKILYLKMARKMQSFPEVSSKFPFPRIFSLLQHGSV